MDNTRFTAELHQLLASGSANLTLVATLLEGGADVNAPDSEGYTPLLRCLNMGTADINAQERAPLQALLSLLLRHGADMDVVSPRGLDPATLASFWNDEGEAQKRLSCEYLRRSDPYLRAHVSEISIYWPEPDSKNIAMLTRSLMKACIAGDVEKVTYFSHIFPTSLSWIDDELMGFEITPLIAAAIGTDATRKQAMLAFLTAAGCDINQQNEEGNTALHYACSAEYRSPAAIRHLIALNADADIPNNAGKTARDMTHDRGFTHSQSAIDALDEALQQRAEQQAQTRKAKKPSANDGFRF